MDAGGSAPLDLERSASLRTAIQAGSASFPDRFSNGWKIISTGQPSKALPSFYQNAFFPNEALFS